MSDRYQQAQALIYGIVETANFMYLIGWTGTKTPRGATINGDPIVSAHHGMVFCERAGQIGNYVRVEEFGGDNHDQHLMLIGLNEEAKVLAPGVQGASADVVTKETVEQTVRTEITRMISLEDDE